MSCGIYKITNLINQKSYIGQSVNISARWRRHKNEINNLNNSYPIYLAFRKYGIENFSFEIIEECQRNELDERERFWIQYYDSYFNGYNQTLGGNGGAGSISLTSNDVSEIIELLKETELTNSEIANEYNVSENTICGINTGYYWKQDNIKYPIRERKLRKSNFCHKCGKEISYNASFCTECFHLERRTCDRPSRDELKSLIRSTSFVQIGKRYEVSDNAVRKWCKSYNLPFRVSDIKLISDEDWVNI